MRNFTLELCIWCVLVFCTTLSASGQQADWDYPIKPGSKEWSELADVNARVKACQIPTEVVSKLSTKQLFTLCTKHPFFRSYIYSNSPIEGFRSSMNSFNGYSELLRRVDALDVMIDYYKNEDFSKIEALKTSIAKGEYSLQLHGVELMMSNEDLILKMDQQLRKSFLKIVQSKYEEKLNSKEELGGFGSVTTAFLGAKLMANISELNLSSQLAANTKLKDFQNRMVPFDKEIIDTILAHLSESVTALK